MAKKKDKKIQVPGFIQKMNLTRLLITLVIIIFVSWIIGYIIAVTISNIGNFGSGVFEVDPSLLLKPSTFLSGLVIVALVGATIFGKDILGIQLS